MENRIGDNMIDVGIYAMIGVCVVFALLGTMYFYLEHNAKNDLSRQDNPIKAKWLVGGLLGGLTVAGIMCYQLQAFEGDMTALMCSYGLIAGLLSILMAKVFNEGISAVAKWGKQKVVEVKEATGELSEILAFMQEQKKETDEIKKRLGL